ncbi:MAG: hypothetical protein JWN53_360 [Gemmatimonadetes bacterium]|jgi:hypothetical protein|nr:hypothetical protein [Gemmatimonadota bacterium]
MTPAERYANSNAMLTPVDQVWELPKSAHVVAGVMALTGAAVGALATGTPVTAGIGFVLGGAVGYGVYAVGEYFIGKKMDGSANLERRVVGRFVELRRHDLRPLAPSELLRMRLVLM